MKNIIHSTFIITLATLLSISAQAQSNVPAPTTDVAEKTNPAIVPVPRTGGATNRQAKVLLRAKENPRPVRHRVHR
ncbi:MAG: hypothetical protein QM813_14090 [Verrucomicrobiota bacterium]